MLLVSFGAFGIHSNFKRYKSNALAAWSSGHLRLLKYVWVVRSYPAIFFKRTKVYGRGLTCSFLKRYKSIWALLYILVAFKKYIQKMGGA
jgi:hypothetical protein